MGRAVSKHPRRATRGAERHQFATEGRDLHQAGSNQTGAREPQNSDLEALVRDAFDLFDTSPERWPDKLVIDRNGTADFNILATWRYDELPRFYYGTFETVDQDEGDSIALSPDFSEAPE